jgi:hypothetical protein
MHFWLAKCCFIISVFVLAGSAMAESEFSVAYPGVELLETKQLEALSHPVLLSAPKRVNNTLRIEKQVQVSGLRTNLLYRLKPGYDLSGALAFYKEFIEANGDIAFECEGRGCGTSSDWSNKVFSQSRLTGRDSNQAYIAGQVQGEGVHGWLSVYAVLSARRDEFVYVSFIPQKNGDLVSEFKRGRLVLADQLGKVELSSLSTYLGDRSSAQLMLLSFHKDMSKGQAENQMFSQSVADSFAAKLSSDLGDLGDRLVSKPMGGLGQIPIGSQAQSWMYLYLVD